MKPQACRILLAALMLMTCANPVDAHIVASRLGDFYAGALHPLLDLQEGVMWGAMGLLAGSMGARCARWLVLAVPSALLVGLFAGLSLGFNSASTTTIAVTMVVLGLLIAAGTRLPTFVIVGLACGVAIIGGLVNAGGVAPGTDRALFAAGLAVTGYATITLITAAIVAFLGSTAEGPSAWRGIVIRICGSWIAAIGLMSAGFALAS